MLTAKIDVYYYNNQKSGVLYEKISINIFYRNSCFAAGIF